LLLLLLRGWLAGGSRVSGVTVAGHVRVSRNSINPGRDGLIRGAK